MPLSNEEEKTFQDLWSDVETIKNELSLITILLRKNAHKQEIVLRLTDKLKALIK